MIPAPIDFAAIAARVNARLQQTWPGKLTAPTYSAGHIELVLAGDAISGVADLIREIAAGVAREKGGRG